MDAFVLAAGAVGLAGGICAGYFYAKHKLQEDFDERLNEENERLRQKYYNIGVDREDDVKAREVSLKETQEYLEDLTSYLEKKFDVKNIYDEIPTEVHRSFTNYNKLAGSYSDPEAASEEAEDVKENIVKEHKEVNMRDIDPIIAQLPEDEMTPEPYFISEQMFWDNQFDYDQTTVTYYPVDGFLQDDHDDFLNNETELFGDLLKTLDRDTCEDIYWVRNNRRKTEFEVVISKTSYAEVVGD